MARVTKINVGGTNYDIAHEGELKNSGFEVVTALPTTGLFEGREVIYENKKYIYSTFYGRWVVAFDEKISPVYNVMGSRGIYEILGYDYTTYNNKINRSYLSKYYNYCNFTDDYLIEVSTDNETFTEIERANKAYQIFNATNRGAFNVSNYKAVRLTVGKSERLNAAVILSFYINHDSLKVNKVKIDHQLRSNLSWEDFGEVDFTAVNPRNYAVFFSIDMFSKPIGIYGLIYKIRFTIEFDTISTNAAISNVFLICEGNKYLAGINNYFNLSYKLLDCYSTVDYPITLNYDVANIEPTQTGEVEKKANWVLRYLLQAVNWLKANDNTKLDKRAYNHIYTNCGYVNFGTNVATGALIIELPFAPNGDGNNSMTYIELNVYSHKKGCSKYIIGVYSFNQNSEYEWSAYSYMGYNYFSNISFGRRTDNNNIVVVLGDFTDVHKYEHFSISNIITGYNRNNDDTDGFLLYTDSDSNNYSILKQSTDIPLNISYNDLTNTPNLATVATSGSYDDLTNTPNLATVATSGSYDDLTNTPNLATVATSGSYNDLTDNPTQLPNPNPIIIKTADGVSVRYDGSTSGGVTLEAGNNAELTATQDSNDTMTVKFGAVVPQTLPNPNALNIKVLDRVGALLGSPIVYDGVDTKYINLIEGYGITLSNSNLSTSHEITINLKQIAGTTLLGNANDTIGIPQAVTMTQLRTMLGSLTLNDIDVTLGGNNSYTLPCYIDYNGVDYPARIRDNWLQIYRNGVWANLMYLSGQEAIQPTQVRQITSFDNLDWYNEQVSEYEVDSTTTTSILNGTTKPAAALMNCLAEQLTLNLYPISGKSSLDSLITDLQGEGFSVFAENDLDTILASGSDYLVRIKISKVPTTKAIIECYVAR